MADDNIRKPFHRDRTFAKYDRRPWSAAYESSIESRIRSQLNNGSNLEDETIQSLTTSNINISESSKLTYQNSSMLSAESMDTNLNGIGNGLEKPLPNPKPLFLSAKNKSTSTPLLLQDSLNDGEKPSTPEPALLGVKQKLVLFEKLNSDVWITITPRKYKEKPAPTKEANLRRFISKWELNHHNTAATFYRSTNELRSQAEEVFVSQRDDGAKKEVKVELTVPIKPPSPTINYLASEIGKASEQEEIDDTENEEVIPLNSIDIPNSEEDTSSLGEEIPTDNLVCEDTEESSNEGEFEFTTETLNKPIVTPPFEQYLVHDNHLKKFETPKSPEVILVPEVDEIAIEEQSGYISSAEEYQSADEVKDYLNNETVEDMRGILNDTRESLTLSFKESKPSVEPLNKSFLSPAFIKFIGFDDGTDHEEETNEWKEQKEENKSFETQKTLDISSPTLLSNHSNGFYENDIPKISAKRFESSVDKVDLKYSIPVFKPQTSRDPETAQTETTEVQVKPNPRTKRHKSKEKLKAELQEKDEVLKKLRRQKSKERRSAELAGDDAVSLKRRSKDSTRQKSKEKIRSESLEENVLTLQPDFERQKSKEKIRSESLEENVLSLKPDFERQKSKEKVRSESLEENALSLKPDYGRQKSKEKIRSESLEENVLSITTRTDDFTRQKSQHELTKEENGVILLTKTKDFPRLKSQDDFNEMVTLQVPQEEDILLKPRTKDFDRIKSSDVFNEMITLQEPQEEEVLVKPRSKDFTRNYRSLYTNQNVASHTARLRGEKYSSLRPADNDAVDVSKHEMYAKGYESIQPILMELIKTEESYVENLWTGLSNYGQLFEQKDLPRGLKGKKYVLFANIEQLAEFHRDEFLPMLHRNRNDLKRLFDEFQQFIEENCFYAYVLYAMNNQRSLELCNSFKKYFKILQTERNDNLGINSFLLQPIQRVARYPLLLKEFIKKLFDNYPMKPIIDSCCRLDKKLQNLLNAVNKSEVINDIDCLSETHEFNIFYQGKFRDVGDFSVHDHTLKRSYRSKVFVYDKCIIYTEIKRKQVIFRGRYPREHIGLSVQPKFFTLYYDRRKQQECDFMGDQALIRQWSELIREIITAYGEEEKARLRLLHCGGNDVVRRRRQQANLLLFRDTNRFSTDSGISNV